MVRLDTVELAEAAGDDPGLVLALAEARFPAGTHDVYQLVLGVRPAEQGWERGVVAEADGVTFYDAFEDPRAAARLGALLGEEARRENEHATVTFRWAPDSQPPAADAEVRPLGAEQSNSSVVFDNALILKAFRRLEAGDNPELEMLRFLSERRFPNIPRLAGWYEYCGELMDATLGVVQRFIPEARDGWELALEEIASAPERFTARMDDLGQVIGRMHTVLGSDTTDPAFAPEEPGDEALSLLTATIDEQIERVFVDLPQDAPALAPIAGRGEEVRDRLRLLSHVGAGGRQILVSTRAATVLASSSSATAHSCVPGSHRSTSRAYRSSSRSSRRAAPSPRQCADRPPPQALAAARRGGNAALVRLRRLRVRAAERHPRAGRLGAGGA